MKRKKKMKKQAPAKEKKSIINAINNEKGLFISFLGAATILSELREKAHKQLYDCISVIKINGFTHLIIATPKVYNFIKKELKENDSLPR